MSLNFVYILTKVEEFYKNNPCDSPRMLDFGCGAGEMIEMAVCKGLSAYGVDSYAESQAHVHDKVLKTSDDISARIFKIEDGVIPFPNNHFDVVVSNQVFEHIEHIDQPLSEIYRVLKPGGMFLALFPTKETWWEGHALVYFPHLMKPESFFQYSYMSLVKKCGFGLDNGIANSGDWAKGFGAYLKKDCFYKRFKDIKNAWSGQFRADIKQLENDYILFRVQQSGKLKKFYSFFAFPLLQPLFRWLCIKRGGRIFTVQK